jgi:hypothetical protein
MTENHSFLITPPPELLQLWFEQYYAYNKGLNELLIEVAQYGADRELEACCEWLDQKVLLQHQSDVVPALRAARRPKSPSLKAQALEEFNHLMGELIGTERYKNRISIVRRALEQLDD